MGAWLSTRGELSKTVASDRIIMKGQIGDYFSAVKEKYNMINPYDISCYVYPIVISSVGYNYWKCCKRFVLSRESYTEERAEYILRTIGPKAIERNIHKAVDRRESINPEVMTRKASNAIPLMVQYEDQVTVKNLSKDTNVKFKAAPGFFNVEPSPIVKACLGKKQDEVFFINGNEYKIINIEKGQGN